MIRVVKQPSFGIVLGNIVYWVVCSFLEEVSFESQILIKLVNGMTVSFIHLCIIKTIIDMKPLIFNGRFGPFINIEMQISYLYMFGPFYSIPYYGFQKGRIEKEDIQGLEDYRNAVP